MPIRDGSRGLLAALGAVLLLACVGLVVTECRRPDPMSGASAGSARLADARSDADDSAAFTGEATAIEPAARRSAPGATDASDGVARPTGAVHITATWAADGASGVGLRFRVGPRWSPFTERVAVTDADGVAVVEDLLPGRYTVLRDAFAMRSVAVVGGDTTRVTFSLPPPPSISGVVVDADGRPVSGAMAYWSGDDLVEMASVATDADGRFRFDGCFSNAYVGARDGDRFAEEQYLSLMNPGEVREVQIELGDRIQRLPIAETGAVAVRVVTPAGTPAVGAEVRLVRRTALVETPAGQHCGEPPNAKTATDGTVRFRRVSPGTVRVHARLAGLPSAHVDAIVAAGKTADAEIQLAAGATLRGRVARADGAPAASAHVLVTRDGLAPHENGRSRPLGETLARADGSFELTTLPAGEWTAFVAHVGFGSATARVVLTAGESAWWDPVLDEGLVVHGRVMDAAAQPLVGWVVELRGGPRQYRAFTGEDGRFVIADCDDRPHSLRVSDGVDFHSVPRLMCEDVRPGPALDLVVPDGGVPSAFVSGVITTPLGRPPRSMRVYAWSEEVAWAFPFPVTASNGRFRIGPLPAAEFVFETWDNLRTWPSKQIARIELKAHDEVDLGTFVLAEPSRLEIRLDRSAVPAAVAVRGEVFDADGVRQGNLRDDGAGTLRPLGPLLPGRCRVSFGAPGVHYVERVVELRGGETTTLEVRLEPATEQELRFRFDSEGERAPFVRVDLATSAGEAVVDSEQFTGADGVWTVGLRPGGYVLRAESRDGRTGSVEFDVGTEPGATVQVSMR